MAKETSPPAQGQEHAAQAAPAAPGLTLKKMLLIGVPLFVVQLGLVYFLLVKFVAPSPASGAQSSGVPVAEQGEAAGAQGAEPVQRIFLVKDLIVNPAGTNGTRFLLTTIGIEVSTGEGLQELEAKDVQVRDVLNTILTAKGLNELVDVGSRESLRTEIAGKVGEMLRNGNLTNVYFSKFIIQ
jgi:flagellar FliL protein